MKTLKRILLVEDNQYDAELTLAALSDAGLGNDVFVVRDGAEALAYLRNAWEAGQASGLPAVVLLDLKLPDSTDLNLLRRLRRLAPNSRVILMTAHGSADVLEEALRAGAFRAVGKPFDLQDMVALVRDAVAA